MTVRHGRSGHLGIHVLLHAEEDRTKEPENVFLTPAMTLTINSFVQAMPKKLKSAIKINVLVRFFYSLYFQMKI